MLRWTKSPPLLRRMYPGLTWHRDRSERTLFLTFDDGPVPNVTEEIISVLDSFGVKGTFFCVGENVVRYPDIFAQLQAGGHRIGNHTHNHLNGWKTSAAEYIENVEKCQHWTGTNLFRPPYSKIRHSQIRALRTRYEIVMWDVLSRDYDARITPERCLEIVLKNAQNGSIIVFHDHEKAAMRTRYALPRAIETWLEAGYRFELL